MKVCLDAGHSFYTEGKRVTFRGNETRERVFNELIVNIIKNKLEDSNIETKIVSGNYFYDSGLAERCRLAKDCDLFVSIHQNAFNTVANGFEIFYTSEEGRLFAMSVQNELQKTRLKDRGVKQGSYYVLKNTKPVAILVECCFYDNEDDYIYFTNHYTEIANNIAQGIIKFAKEMV